MLEEQFLYTHGMVDVYLDEVHKYKDRKWTALLKNFYGTCPDLNNIYTGSAMLAIEDSTADLSRKRSFYTLHGMSPREYFEYAGIASVRAIRLEELLFRHTEYALDIISRMKMMKCFCNCLRTGCYPYCREDYLMRVVCGWGESRGRR